MSGIIGHDAECLLVSKLTAQKRRSASYEASFGAMPLRSAAQARAGRSSNWRQAVWMFTEVNTFKHRLGAGLGRFLVASTMRVCVLNKAYFFSYQI